MNAWWRFATSAYLDCFHVDGTQREAPICARTRIGVCTPRNRLIQTNHRHRIVAPSSESGQALLLGLILTAILLMMGSGMAVAYYRSALQTAQRADDTAALQAAEAGLAAGMRHLVNTGDLSFSLDGTVPSGRTGASWKLTAAPDTTGGAAVVAFVSEGVSGHRRRSIRLRLGTPFAQPIYAQRDLTFNADSLFGAVDFDLQPEALYGRTLTASHDVNLHGDIRQITEAQRLRLPGVTYDDFAS